ncbi:hypothetical protein EV284_2799 [Streptomyces sp. BK022]|uniref:hypothetical protein n=1 Tax=Streptomyces sp. BK022 TaxID=2512123 RepID=UPI0010DF7009|nr:hypothetical protein [Streptomyces sp. BK022]RZU37621.1 hypothetical protein EV284_2799 [Streptomyces sp. BK022]
MGWVTMIGPSDEQVEYRPTGGHGCGKSVTVDAAPLVAAIEAKAEAAGSSVASLLPNREAKRAYFRARGLLRSRGTARFTGFDAVEVAATAGLDARDLYGENTVEKAVAAEVGGRAAVRPNARRGWDRRPGWR